MPEATEEKPKLSWGDFRRICRLIGDEKSEWAGMPVPINGLDIILEERYPYRELEKMGQRDSTQPLHPDYKIVNSWYSKRLRVEVCILRTPDGKLALGYLPNNASTPLVNTIGACDAWDLEAETRAIEKLAEMIPIHKLNQYALCGMFLETSKRSGITYLFRKLRPTLAMKKNEATGSVNLICALCLHPIGYYAMSWGGTMCPTDEIIAHLAMMKGDEFCYWKRANQHNVNSPQAGLNC